MDSTKASIQNHPGFIAFKAKAHSATDTAQADKVKDKQELAADKEHENK